MKPFHHRSQSWRLAAWRGSSWLLLLTLLGSAPLRGDAPPQLRELSQRGLQLGGTTRLTLQGSGLSADLRVLLPIDPPARVILGELASDHVELQVQIADRVVPGLYPLRIATSAGVSNALVVGVDALPQLSFRESLASLPAALHGNLTGDQILHTQFAGRKGQRLVIDLQAQRIGSSWRPVLRLESPKHQHLGTAVPSQQIGGDARLVTTLPDDGLYRLEMHDLVFRGAEPGAFRLLIGDFRYADGVYPLAIERDKVSDVEWIAVGQADTHLQMNVGGDFDIPGVLAFNPVDAATPFVGAVPAVRVTPGPNREWREADINPAQPITSSLPLAINGRLTSPGEQDTFRVAVPAGTKLHCEVWAQRWQSPLDAVLDVLRPDGQVLAHADDQPASADPSLEFEVPPELNEVWLRVSSLVGQSGADAVYRLSLVPSTLATHTELRAATDRVAVPAGQRYVLPLEIAQADGQARRLQWPAVLQSSLRCSTAAIAPHDEQALVAFEASAAARGEFPLRLLAASADPSSVPPASLATRAYPGAQYQPLWRDVLWVAVTPPAPLSVDWSPETTSETLPRGAQRELPVWLQRAPGATGNVRLTLMSTQRMPTKTINNQQENDLDRALRIDAMTLPSNADRGTVVLHVPSDLPLHDWAFAIQAELLSADETQVLATAYTTVRRWPTIEPLRLTAEIPERIEIKAGDDGGWKLTGRIDRHPDFISPVTVRWEGLAGSDPPQPEVMVAESEQEFALPLTFPAGTAAREIPNVRLALVARRSETSSASPPLAVQYSRPFTIVIRP